ncbi:MAG: hypothetical protein ACJZ2N_02240 [Candidatus Poseidoniales archaeon]
MSNWKLLIVDGKSHLVDLDSEIIDIPNFGSFPSKSLSSQSDNLSFDFLGSKCSLINYSLTDVHSNLRRGPQIISPKDIAWIIYKSGLSNGDNVVEAGSGSAALTVALAQAVAPEGKVVTFESNSKHVGIAKSNIDMSPWEDLVEFHEEELSANTSPIETSTVILDLPNPQSLVGWSRKSLKVGGLLICYLPTINQVEALLPELDLWSEVEIVEIMQRSWRPKLSALRPESTMLGHTGFIVSARLFD